MAVPTAGVGSYIHLIPLATSIPSSDSVLRWTRSNTRHFVTLTVVMGLGWLLLGLAQTTAFTVESRCLRLWLEIWAVLKYGKVVGAGFFTPKALEWMFFVGFVRLPLVKRLRIIENAVYC